MIELAQPGALWTALAIGLPILAHMAYRRVSQKHAFPSLRFIRPSQIPRTGRKTPTDFPLLLLRILLFLILAFLLADPHWKTDSSSASGDIQQETLFALDLSPSMAGWGALEEAKNLLEARVDETEGRSGMLTFGAEVLDEWAMGTQPEELKEALAELSHDWRKGDAQGMLERVTSLFSDAAASRRLVVVSDFQQSDWQTAWRDFSQSGIECEWIQVGQGDSEKGREGNRGVVEARAVPAGPGKLRVWVVARNWEDREVEEKLILYAGGEERESQKILLPPRGSTQAQFILSAGDFSKAVVQVSGDDAFSLDNERAIWLKAPPARRFGFWLDNPDHPQTKEEMAFLNSVMLSMGDRGWNRWESNQDQADGLRLGDEQSSLEFLSVIGVDSWFEQEELSTPLKLHLEKGGVALVTPGDRFSSTASVLNQSGLMDFSFLRVAGAASLNSKPFRIAALEQGGQLDEVFQGKSARDLYLTSIRRFGILRKLGEQVEVPLRDREGRPLALIRRYESGGRLIFLPFRLASTWTDLPLRNSFLPLLAELSRTGVQVSGQRAWPVLEPGETYSASEEFVAEKPGVFRLGEEWLEVMLSPPESSPDTLALDDLKQSFGGGANPLPVQVDTAGLGDSASESLWLWFVLAATILLVVEMIWSRPQNENLEETPSTDA
tara:strand:- start:96 stop:2093 length:1998 start_codon:yes stop_codon:yes gene_type:complete